MLPQNRIRWPSKKSPIILGIILFMLLIQTGALGGNQVKGLSVVVSDDPGSLILPVALFVTSEGDFLILDPGSNSGVLKTYSSDGKLLDWKLTSCLSENYTSFGMSHLNPFGMSQWGCDGRNFLLLERTGDSQALRSIGPGSDEVFTLDGSITPGIVGGSSDTPMFTSDGLLGPDAALSKSIDLYSMTKVLRDKTGNIYALNPHTLRKFNTYGIPQWSVAFPDDEQHSFLPISLAASADNVAVAGVQLPEGITTSDFLQDFEGEYASNPAQSPSDLLTLLDSLGKFGNPVIGVYSSLDGRFTNGILLEQTPMWVCADAKDNFYTLLLNDRSSTVSRISPDFSEALPLFTIELAKKELEGTSRLALDKHALYFDQKSIAFSVEGSDEEALSIIKKPLSGLGVSEKVVIKPISGHTVFTAGLAISDDGSIYIAGFVFELVDLVHPNGLAPEGAFLDHYSDTGEFIIDFLSGADKTLLPNALAVSPDGDILLAASDEARSISSSWAMRFGADGKLKNEYFHLGPGGVNYINMAAGGTVAVASDGTIYQCDNIPNPDPLKAYIRRFSPDGKFLGDLRKASLIHSGLLCLHNDNPILVWQGRYILETRDDEIIAQWDLGEHFIETQVLEAVSGGEEIYILASDGAIYEMDYSRDFIKADKPLADVDAATETLRGYLNTFYRDYHFLPDKLNIKFWEQSAGDKRVDEVFEMFFGPGVFDYSPGDAGNFSFMLFGRDPYQTLYKVSRDGVDEVY